MTQKRVFFETECTNIPLSWLKYEKNSDKRLLLDAEIYFNGTKQSYNHTQLTNKRIID